MRLQGQGGEDQGEIRDGGGKNRKKYLKNKSKEIIVTSQFCFQIDYI